jgi:hypothetical protein
LSLKAVGVIDTASGLVHVAIGKPGLVESINPRKGGCTQFMTAVVANTTALIAPDVLYVFSPYHQGSASGSVTNAASRTSSKIESSDRAFRPFHTSVQTPAINSYKH